MSRFKRFKYYVLLIPCCLFVTGCWQTFGLRPPNCLEGVQIAVKTRTNLSLITADLFQAEVIDREEKEATSKTLRASQNFTEAAEIFCMADKDDVGLITLQKGVDLLTSVCDDLGLNDKDYCKAIK